MNMTIQKLKHKYWIFVPDSEVNRIVNTLINIKNFKDYWVDVFTPSKNTYLKLMK